MGFYFADPPDHLEMPQTLQTMITIELAAICAIFMFIALRDLRRTGSAIGVLLIIGGFIAVVHEANIDALGHVWHPRDGWTLIETIGPIPVWTAFAYAGFEGGVAYVLYKRAKKGITVKGLWMFYGAMMLANVVLEIPLLAMGLYDYYGNPPLEFFGFPLMWPAAALAPIFVTVALLTRAPALFVGWRKVILLIEPALAWGAVNGAIAWPAQSVLHLESKSEIVNQLGGLVTLAMALGLVSILIQTIAKDGRFNRGRVEDVQLDGAGDPGPVVVEPSPSPSPTGAL